MSWWNSPPKSADRIKEALKSAAKSGDVYPSTEYTGPSFITLPANSSKLSKEQLVDRIKGAIFGNAIGDAVGLLTEFHSKASSVEKYGAKGPLLLTESVRGWAAGDWTDDTDQMILILDGILRHGGKIEHIDFAQRLAFWVRHGFPELGDFGGNGCGGVVAGAVYSEEFKKNPYKAAKAHFDKTNGWAAANGAVMRTSILGIPCFNDIAKVIDNTKKISLATHYDPRCTASSVACTTAIALMLQGELYDPKKPETVEAVLAKALEYARAEMKNADQIKEFDLHCSAKTVDDLKLDEPSKIGYTFKCIGSGVYYMRTSNDFLSAITELALEGGDADTNGAVAGAMLGCKLGYAQLPKIWLDALCEKEWLMKKVTRFLDLLGLGDTKDNSAVSDNKDVKDAGKSSSGSVEGKMEGKTDNSASNSAKSDTNASVDASMTDVSAANNSGQASTNGQAPGAKNS